VETLLADVRHALRRLLKSPGFTTVAALTLALGIGANATMFSALDALLIQPLPYKDPATLVRVEQTDPRTQSNAVAPGNFADWRERTRSFAGLAAWEVTARTILEGEKPRRVGACIASGNLFDVLGVAAAHGRTFGTGSEGLREVVLSDTLWQSQFGGDPGIVGRDVRLDDQLVHVTGVMPPGFAYPREAELWLRAERDLPEMGLPVTVDLRELRDARYLVVVGRLRPGVTVADARREMDRVAAQLAKDFKDANEGQGARVTPLSDDLRGSARPTLMLLLATVAFVLLIACANVANLLLARAVGRRPEMAVRAALGASRGRLVRQLLTETATLVLLGTGLGLLLARGGQALLVAFWPASLPPLEGLNLSRPVLALTAGVAAVAVMVVGVLPARLASSAFAVGSLRSSGRAPVASPSAHRARGAFVIAEVALAVVLVAGAGLLIGSLRRLADAPLGFEPEGVLSARLSLPGTVGHDLPTARTIYGEIERRLAALPGVRAVGVGHAIPLGGRRVSAGLRVEGRVQAPNDQLDASWRVVSPGYFSALGMAVERGRGFDDHDVAGALPVTLVNATLARMIWPGEDPLGQRIATGLDGPEGTWTTVVGVVADTPQESVAVATRPEMYRPLGQDQRFGAATAFVLVRTAGDPLALAPVLERAVLEVRKDVPVSDVKPLVRLRGDSIAGPRVLAQVLGLASLLALFLAALGLYGVLSCAVGERTNELGVRLSLGAQPSQLIALVLRRSAALAGAGVVLGLAFALALSRLLQGWLFGVRPHDPWTLGVVAAVLMLTALVAGYGPARRAGRLDPAVVLRGE